MNEGRRRKLLQAASAAVFLVVIVVAVLVVVAANRTEGGDTKLEGIHGVERELAGIPQSGLTLGDPSAKVTLIEYGDLKCPVCKGFSEGIVPEVIDSQVRSGRARLLFRNYTIIDSESIPAAAAAIAAGEQGRGWQFVELFYRNQGLETDDYVNNEFLTSLAKGSAVPDISRWNEERTSDAVLRQVMRETEEAQGLGFTGTPSFAIAGPSIEGKKALGTPGDAGTLEAAIESAG